MKVTAIFEKIRSQLFAARFNSHSDDELDNAFNAWCDPGYLREFFAKYRQDLIRFEPGIKIGRAVHKVFIERKIINDLLMEMAHRNQLDRLFKPLDNRENEDIDYDLQKLKARGPHPKSMLRLYAVKHLDSYVVSGCAIKLTNKMERPHLKAELHKLELLRQHLRDDNEKNSFVYLDI